MPCIVCNHNQIKDIDRALLTGATLTSLSQKYGFTTSALHRHQEHLMQKMAQAQPGVSRRSAPGLILQTQPRHGNGPGRCPGGQGRRGFQIVPPGQPGIHPHYQPHAQNGCAPGTRNDLLPDVIPPVGSPGQPPAQCLPDPVRHPPDLESQPFRGLPGTRTRPGSSSAPNSRNSKLGTGNP